MKKLSIIVPAYNCEKYIEKCLKSITNEMDNSIELIVIDDGSKDSTAVICNKFVSDNIKLISNPNHGVSYSRNEGIEIATGKYIMFVDADDYLSKGWKNAIFEAIKSNKDAYFFSSHKYENKITKEMIINNILGLDKTIKWLATPWAKVFNKKLLYEHNIRFIEKIINGEDMLFNIEVTLKCENFEFIEKNIYNYRICNTSVTNSFNAKILDSDVEFQKKLIQILKKNNIDEVKYSRYCIQNAIIMFVKKFSMINLKKSKEFYSIFEKEPYCTCIKSITKFENIKNKIIIILIKKKKYKRAIIMMKLFRIIKNKKTFDHIINI